MIRIDDRDVLFEVNDKTYSIHVGQNFAEAMRKPLSVEKLKELKRDAKDRGWERIS